MFFPIGGEGYIKLKYKAGDPTSSELSPCFYLIMIFKVLFNVFDLNFELPFATILTLIL